MKTAATANNNTNTNPTTTQPFLNLTNSTHAASNAFHSTYTTGICQILTNKTTFHIYRIGKTHFLCMQACNYVHI
jgi:hypothetical protein